MIELCTIDLTLCRTTLTNASGQYRLRNIPAGTFNLRAIPPGVNLPGRLGPITIADNETLSGQDIILLGTPPSPPLDPIEPAHTGGGTIVVYWMNGLTLTAYGCVNATASFELNVLDDDYTLTGAMTEMPVGSGIYKASIPPLYPHHGVAEVIYTINCPGGSTVEIPFFIYIDPSGVVKNTSGMPIPDATVTLFYADTSNGPFTAVPNDSTLMSPSNRNNPDTTNANGEFGWDVVAGFYKVRAEKAGCFSPTDPTQTFVESAVLTIPPPVTDLELILKCSVLPSASAGGPYSINEGDTVTLDASASSDPEAGLLIYEWDLDANGEYDDATGVTTSKTFPDNGIYIVGLKVTNQYGEFDTDTAEINVANISPSVTIQQAAANNLGVFSGNGLFADPGADTWTASINYGDGTGDQSLALNPDKSFLLSHTYSSSGDYMIEACVSDDDGGSGCDQIQVTVVTNQPPVADAGGPYSGNEGTTINLSASKSTDPDNSIVLYEWDFDNDGQFDDATGKKPKFKAIDNGVFTVQVRVTDAGGLSSVDAATVTVRNLPPVITSLLFNSPVRVGVEVNARATFKDAGINDTFTAVWKWGDGTTSAGTVNGSTATGSHTYKKSGIYLVTVTVKDNDGGMEQAYRLIIVLPKK
jgi:PKD repeat protein